MSTSQTSPLRPGPLRLGTRASALATTQSGHVAELVRRLGVEVELVSVSTEGDVNTSPLATIGGTGVFVSALRDALLRDDVDFAVHSLKDLPTTPAARVMPSPTARTRATSSWPATGSPSVSCPTAAASAPVRRGGPAS